MEGLLRCFQMSLLLALLKHLVSVWSPDEEFEEYLRHLIGESCTGDRNEMAQLPEGITELVHHEKLKVPLVKCQNVIILTATNVVELDREWDCLIELMTSNGLLVMEKFLSKKLAATLSDVEISQPLSNICMEFPDLYIGAYRESREGPMIITFEGKNGERFMDGQEKEFDSIILATGYRSNVPCWLMARKQKIGEKPLLSISTFIQVPLYANIAFSSDEF